MDNPFSHYLNPWLAKIYSSSSGVQFFVPDFREACPVSDPGFKCSCVVEAPVGATLGVVPFHIILDRVFVARVDGEATLIVPNGGIHSYSLGLKEVGHGWWVDSGSPFALVVKRGARVSLSVGLSSFASLQRLVGADALVRS